MAVLVIDGPCRLWGEVRVHGAKNSTLPLLAACLLCRSPVVLHNCPRLTDVDTSIKILRHLGCIVQRRKDDLWVDPRAVCGSTIPEDLMREMRSSVIFLGAILARWGQAALSSPGGCELGPRPIDLHLTALRALGAAVEDRGGTLRCEAGGLQGTEIVLSLPSVGATENAILAACGAEGTTVICNAAREPEIEDLQNFLTVCGADITGAGTSTIRIRGRRPLHGGTYTVMPDRIAAATYLCACASASGEVYLRDARENHLSTVTAVLRAAGCTVNGDESGLRCRCEGRLTAPPPIRTAPYPGFPTDVQAIVMAALLRCRGAAVFEENLFSSRYRHVDELARMGADVRTYGRVAVVLGTERLHGAAVRCTDLRGGAALCVAALAAEGETVISDIGHIDRGYASIEGDLRALGADIRRRETDA